MPRNPGLNDCNPFRIASERGVKIKGEGGVVFDQRFSLGKHKHLPPLRREAAQPTPDLSQGETRHTDNFISGLDQARLPLRQGRELQEAVFGTAMRKVAPKPAIGCRLSISYRLTPALTPA